MEALVKRHIEPIARLVLAHSPGLVIEGARQVGKSTLAGQLVAGSDAVVMNLDDESTRAAAEHDMAGFIAQAESRTLVVDEIQRLPALTLAVKSAIDRDRRPGRFLLTGSATLLRARGIADSLAGRVVRLPMYGFSQGERRRTPDAFIARLAAAAESDLRGFRSDVSRSDYAALIAVGAYPDAQDGPDRMRNLWFDSYVANIVRRDLGELRRQVDSTRAESVLRALAGQQAGELVKAHVAERAAVPMTTITGYLDLLTDVGLVTTIPPWTPNLASREVGRRKVLVTDTGLAARLTRVTAEQLARIDHGEALGSFLEGFVALELLRQQTWSEQEFELFHYRDRTGLEVDLIAELSGGAVIGIEVKASTSFSGNHFAGLRAVRDRLGGRFVAGVVLNTGREGYRFGDRLYGLPVSALWEF